MSTASVPSRTPDSGGAHEGDVTFLGVPGRGRTEDWPPSCRTPARRASSSSDADGSLWQRIRVVNQPSFAFVGSDGSLETFAGAVGEEQLRTRASALVAG